MQNPQPIPIGEGSEHQIHAAARLGFLFSGLCHDDRNPEVARNEALRTVSWRDVRVKVPTEYSDRPRALDLELGCLPSVLVLVVKRYAAFAEPQDAFGPLGRSRIMRDHHDGSPFGVELFQEADDLLAGFRI